MRVMLAGHRKDKNVRQIGNCNHDEASPTGWSSSERLLNLRAGAIVAARNSCGMRSRLGVTNTTGARRNAVSREPCQERPRTVVLLLASSEYTQADK